MLAPLSPPPMLGKRMGAVLVAALREMAGEARALVLALPRAPGAAQELSSAMDALPDDAQRRLNALYARWQHRFASIAEEWSRRMLSGVAAHSTAQLSLGLKDMAERLEIQATMASPRVRAVAEAATAASVGLITRIPQQYLGAVQTAVMSAITTGSGLERLVPYLTKKYKGDARHAQLTALDQVRKASENFNEARVRALGAEEYVWLHTGGERYPRKLHQRYSGHTFRYDDPPVIDERTKERGKPGDAINCRCRARPVFKFTRMVQ